jgi:hypothetical protein
MSRILVTTAFLWLAVTPAHAETLPQPVGQMIAVANDLNGMCRGWFGSDPHTEEVCAVRDKAMKAVGDMGYCYGPPEGQPAYAAKWHRCRTASR